MSNAKLLIPILLVSLALVHSALTQPQLERVSQEKLKTTSLEKSVGDASAEITVLGRFAAGEVDKTDIDQVMVESLARWSKTQKDYGVSITEMGGLLSGAVGQSVIPTAQMRSVNPASGLQTQDIVLKGTYIALEDLQDFLDTQVVAAGASLAAIKLKGYVFEARVQIFGTTPKTGA
jgi:hypothetical protein